MEFQLESNLLRDGSGESGQNKAPPSGTFRRIKPDTKFLEGDKVEGVHLLTDYDLVRELQVRLGKFIPKGKKDFFSVMWPVSLSTDNVHLLASEPYVVGPKPSGPRFLLYVDPSGDIFLENMTQHIFRVDEDHAIKMESFDGRPITDTLLDGIVTREKLNGADASCDGNGEDGTTGKLTFVICDAIRCNGKDLTSSSILQRIACVRDEIMKPRMFAMKNRMRSDEKEAFDLDIVEYHEAYQTENYLSREFVERYKYPFRSLLFFPRKKLYRSSTNKDSFQWQEGDIQECSFRLKIPKGVKEPKAGQLYVGGGGPHVQEIVHGQIALTEEIKKLDGCIIDCRYFDHQWLFIKQRHDRNYPNGRRSVMGKLAALEKAVSRDLLLTNLEKSKGLN
ncbi:hypothetical protein DAPPUDRAFT_319589 [Daphnia pulex]|uniref:mRNA capping enzyme adenylation domain-containing protein n=1 Tax=Daphnia pulex TaxID=6669 RepID=E9GM77_DAPPU|nr:hypothetical protein DAPPUDRAFT_319589 [Daphnia pulex]|eukprot:EFX79314.1 hypothetical protein DAPPUDRAFT_319589 [Daphnia pulex]